jgi:hypothetical protein
LISSSLFVWTLRTVSQLILDISIYYTTNSFFDVGCVNFEYGISVFTFSIFRVSAGI